MLWCEKLKAWLELHNVTRTQFATRIGVTEMSVSRWIRGEARPEWENLQKIHDATNGFCRPDDLLGA